MEMNRVLTIKKNDALFQADPLEFIQPNGESVFQTEFSDVLGDRCGILWPAGIVTADLNRPAIGQTNIFGKMVEHDDASKGGRQGGDKQSVIAPRDDASDGSGSVTTDTVGGQPLLSE